MLFVTQIHVGAVDSDERFAACVLAVTQAIWQRRVVAFYAREAA